MPTYDVTYNEPLLIAEIDADSEDEAWQIVVAELAEAAARASRDPDVFIRVVEIPKPVKS